MKTWRIPVSWEVCGVTEVEADSLEEAIEIAETDESIALPDGIYIEGSWKVDTEDTDYVRGWLNNNQEDDINE